MLKLHDSSTWFSAYPVLSQRVEYEFERIVGVSTGGKNERTKAVF
jgi:hypothetical protein